ncbi:MAG: C-GCAxxG-C-C family protein [Clostridia bacterium]
MSERSMKSKEIHSSGFNCAQSVVASFDDIPACDQLIKAATSFGAGVGGKRQVCGAVSGMCMVAGVERGYNTPNKGDMKKNHTALVSEMCDDFEAVAGSIVCGELLGLPGFKDVGVEKKMPCSELIQMAVEIAEKHLK